MSEREYNPDPKYGSILVSRLLNQTFKRGKKSTGSHVLYRCFEIIKEQTKKDPLEILDEAVKNVSPLLEVKAKRIGGATYQVPIPVMGARRTTLAIRWILAATRARKGKPMAEKLATELVEAAEKRGAAIKKKEDIQKMAEANRAFAHFA
ncbi:MAG: 30S ribosomal protein S7 [Candidatus Moranbacteria bacterium]|nr:30S ribosomal protein S7 [Candidatus Moranbacteria bacterium]